MTETQSYREWLVRGDTHGAVIETISVTHPAWASTFYLANWDVDVTATIQDDGAAFSQLFTASRFFLEPSVTETSTHQTTSLVMSNYGGALYSELKALTPDQRQTPITIRPRLYMTTDLTNQLVNPSPKWTLHSVTADFDAVTGDLQVDPLRVYRTGRYYTALEFPVLQVAR